MTPVIHTVTKLDTTFRPWSWSFAEQRRTEIDAYFADKQRDKPELFNGRVLLGRNPVFTADTFSAAYFETDFASFLAWRDWGFPDKAVFNGFGMGALRGNDGGFVLGEMAGHTANAGRIYFPSGTPDPSDLRGNLVDIPGSVIREVAEETGLTAADYRLADGWRCIAAGSAIAMIRILDAAATAASLRATIEANSVAQTLPEFSAFHLVHSPADFTPTMPVFVTAFLADQFRRLT